MTATIIPPAVTLATGPERRSARPVPTARLVKVELRKMFDTRSGCWMLVSIGVLSFAAAASVLIVAPDRDVTYETFTRAIGFPMSVILPIIATVSSYQIAETLKLLTGQLDRLHGSLMQFDLWLNSHTRLNVRERMPDCPTCGEGRFEYLTIRGGQMVASLCGRNAVQITPASPSAIDFDLLAEQLRDLGEVSYNRFLLKFRLGEHEITVFSDARSIIKGTDDPNLARSLYSRYIGA